MASSGSRLAWRTNMTKTKKTSKRLRAQPRREAYKRAKNGSARGDTQLAEAALAALRKLCNREGVRIDEPTVCWHFLSADQRRILIGTSQGHLVVLGAFAITKTRRIGRPQTFNLHGLEMSWRKPARKKRLTESELVAEAAFHANLEASQRSFAR